MTTSLAPEFSETPEPGAHLLSIENLSIRFTSPDRDVFAVTEVTIHVDAGEVFALVGESGSGKSVTAASIMGLLPVPPAIVTGSIKLEGRELTGLSDRAMTRVRGREIGMVFQDPMSSLNPVHPVGRQIGESLRLHFGMSRRDAKKQAIELLERVGIPDPVRRATDYPHEFSGGMRQRAVIAMALACDPKLLIADEPTTALDVTVQNQIVELVRELQAERNMAVIWITHDLGVVAEIADRVAVMYGGRIMETSSADEVYSHPRHPYTAGLLRSIPRLDRAEAERLAEIPGTPRTISEPLAECAFEHRCPMDDIDCRVGLPMLEPTDRPAHFSACVHHAGIVDDSAIWVEATDPRSGDHDLVEIERAGEPIVEIDDLAVHFPSRKRGAGGAVRAVDGVDLTLRRGRTLGVVGESGCGKTTLGRALVGLVEPTRGTITVKGSKLDSRSSEHRRVIQMIFQDPFSSMNPGMRVRDIIAEPLRIHPICPPDEIDERVASLLVRVGLTPEVASRHPHEFSGGQRQRIAVARALAAEPEVIVCDEPVSALDVSVQAQIVNLLRDLQQTTGLSFLFIAHDLAVVRHISDEVAVMYLGQIVERAPKHQIYTDPLHPYTKALLQAVPVPDPSLGHRGEPLEGDIPSPSNPPDGCRFHTRCPVAIEGICSTAVPEFREAAPGRWVACHLVDGPELEFATGHPTNNTTTKEETNHVN